MPSKDRKRPGTPVSDLPRRARVYVAAVMLGGICVTAASVYDITRRPFDSSWLVLAALTLFTGSFSIKLPAIRARISVSEAFVFAAVLLFGPSVATIVVAFDAFVLTSWKRSTQRSRLRTLFNMSAGTTAIWTAAHLFSAPLAQSHETARLDQLFLPVLALALSYFVANSSLIAIAIGLESGARPFDIWRRNFAWLGLNYIGGASVAMLLVNYTRRIDFAALGVIVPLLVITYLTFRTSLARLEDAHRHVEQLNDLYLSTIETLAMAVDAKDQITHGHIRRVQVYAVDLARRLGMTNDQHVRAIEAAALLHDMGKLAIPEHILNKPGHLTEAEFEKMKRHADIGADLLSSIRFPYPVVPMVRHHHERWDGKGYPSGISGADIPLGARILSVVDCFDALTSDRPYRPRLSVDDAFAILRDRRGSMYDPLVVDTFIAAYAEIAPAAITAGEQAKTVVNGIELRSADERSLMQIRASAMENAVLSECARALAGVQSDTEALQHGANCVRQLMPAKVFCLFRYDTVADALVCAASLGDPLNLLRDLRIRLGERVSGWSAANRRTSVNSDASLEMGQLVESFSPHLRSCLATPMIKDQRLIGVLTAYSAQRDAFSESHRYVIEQVAELITNVEAETTSNDRNTLVTFPSKRHRAERLHDK
jgi:putative nucleotidyltransferase with HDIG domain